MALPPSEGSSGIWTFKRGRETPPPTRRVLDRDGGVKVVSGIEDMDPLRLMVGWAWVLARCNCGGELVALFLDTLPTSIDCDRLTPPSEVGSKAARCWERIDRFSSMGVKMLARARCGCFLMAVSSKRACRPVGSGLALGSTGAGGCGSCGGARC